METILDIKVVEHPVIVNDSISKQCRTVPEFNIIVKTKVSTLNLIRYIPDLKSFDALVKTHYQRIKIPFPCLIESVGKLDKRRSIRNFFFHMSTKSNAEKIEKYLWRCSSDPLLKSSTLLRDFFSPQREGDCRVDNDILLQSHATATSLSDDQMVPSPSGKLPKEEEINEGSPRCSTELHKEEDSVDNEREWVPSPEVSVISLSRRSIHHDSASSSLLSPYLELEHPLLEYSPLEHLEMVKVLGKGCMGKVMLVKSKTSKKLYALKSIMKEHVIEQKEITHTLDEKDILSRLSEINHPYLAKLHASFQDEHRLYLLTSYYCGGDIATYMARLYNFSRDCALFYAAEIIEGIGELHRLGILYRDLKPENILLTNDGHIILTDFGLSKCLTASNDYMTQTFCGTAEYLAPEVLLGEIYSFAIDYWSFGTILYEMLAGITPFWADNHADMYRRVLEDPLEFQDDIFDYETAEFLTDILDRNPSSRLGANGVNEVKEHPYFADIDWDGIRHRRLHPPYLPPVASELDFSNFDPDFLAMTPALTPIPSEIELSRDLQDVFDGYSFTDEMYTEIEKLSSTSRYDNAQRSLHEDGFYTDGHVHEEDENYQVQLQPARKRGSVSMLSNAEQGVTVIISQPTTSKDEERTRYAKRRNTNTSEQQQHLLHHSPDTVHACMPAMYHQEQASDLNKLDFFSGSPPDLHSSALMELDRFNTAAATTTRVIQPNEKALSSSTKSLNTTTSSTDSSSKPSSKARRFFLSFLLSS
ncbi:MAG: kinase-like domain-containing protein [Benjaminiella poitrasii]|nr:MAG: kinase-like domain-containing protein [Benjaminiella poitrasii]